MQVRPRCVLVDDDPDSLLLVRRLLAQLCPALEVTEFSSAVDALHFLVDNHVQLVVTDFRMPLLDGLEFTAGCRSFDPDVPIVMISDDEMEDRALAHGANAFVAKRTLSTQLAPVLQWIGLPMAHSEPAQVRVAAH